METDLGQGWAGIGGSCCYSQGRRPSLQTFTAFLSRGHCRAKRYQHLRLVSHGRFLRSMDTGYGYLSHLDPWQVVGPFHHLSSSRWSYQVEDIWKWNLSDIALHPSQPNAKDGSKARRWTADIPSARISHAMPPLSSVRWDMGDEHREAECRGDIPLHVMACHFRSSHRLGG